MSVGSNLQEMENVVTKGSAASDPMPKAGSNASGVMTPGQTGNWEDLGGPTPENYRTDDNSAKLKEPTIATVKDIVNRGAKPPEPMPSGMKEEEEIEGEVVYEEESSEEEIFENEESSEEDIFSEEPQVDYSIEEDVQALLSGEELSEEFQEKARTIFEAAIKSKVSENQEELVGQYEKALEEEVISIKSELTERVDAYLEYVSQEWITENQLAVEKGLKSEMTESFLTGMKSLLKNIM